MGLPIGHRNGVKLRRRGNGIYRIPKPHGIPFYNPSPVYEKHDYIGASETSIKFQTSAKLRDATPSTTERLRGNAVITFAPWSRLSSTNIQEGPDSHKLQGTTSVHFWQYGKLSSSRKLRGTTWITFNTKLLNNRLTAASDITFGTAATVTSYLTTPTNLAAEAISDTAIRLTWDDNSTAEEGYEIEYSTNGSDFSLLDIVGADVETYDATGLTANTQYWFRIRAYNDTTAIYSHYSNIADDWTSVTLTVSARGDGSGVAAFTIKVSSALELRLSGSARFYTDAAGTTGESINTTVAATGSLVTKYIKCPSGTCNLQFMDANYLIGFGHAVGLGGTTPVWGRSIGGSYDANTPGLNATNWIFPNCVDIGIAYNTITTFISDLSELSPSLERITLNAAVNVAGELSDIGSSCVLFSLIGANTISGNINTLTSSMQYLGIAGSNTITGDIANMPTGMIRFEIGGNNTLSGDIADLPQEGSLTHFYVMGNNTISGSIANLDYSGIVLVNFSVGGNNSISGAPSDIPSSVTTFYLAGNSSTYSGNVSGVPATLDYITLSGTSMSLTGNIGDLPEGLLQIVFTCPNDLTGDVSGFPSTLTNIIIYGSNTISGNVSGLPSGLTHLNIQGSNTITGNISGLPTSLVYLYLWGANTVSGSVAGFSSNIRIMQVLGNNTISGAISAIPSGITQIQIAGSNTISGSLSDISNSITQFILEGANTVDAYTSGKTWSNGFIYSFTCKPASGGGLNSTEIDNLFIDLDTSWTTTRSQIIDMRGTNAAPTATSLSARNSLISKGRTIYVNS